MPYKYILTAVSSVGDTHQKTDEFYFADGISSVVKDVCNTARTRSLCKGKKHIFSVVSCHDRFNTICSYLSHSLLKRNNESARNKVQYWAKDIANEIYTIAGKDDDARLAMLYIDGTNIYASGFGETHIYHTSKKSSKATKVTFRLPSLSDAVIADDEGTTSDDRLVYSWSRCLGELKPGDEYLVVGSCLHASVGDETICDALANSHINAATSLVDTAYTNDSSCTLTAIHILVKKTFPVLWTILGASLFVIALALIFLL